MCGLKCPGKLIVLLALFGPMVHPAAGQVPATSQTQPAPVLSPAELFRAGLAEVNNKNYKKAREYFEADVAMNPKDAAAWNNLGLCYMNLGLLDKAADALEKAIEANPNEAYAYNNLGAVYQRRRDYDKAIELYQKQIEVRPADQRGHANLGQLYFSRGRYREAIPELESAAAIPPDSASVQLYLGRAYLKISDVEKAVNAFDKAIDLGSTPAIQNDIAYELASLKVQLDRAESLAQPAVSAVGSQLRNVSLDTVRTADIANVIAMVHYWDTMGWVEFQKGDLAAAEKYLAAAWTLGDEGVVADHLAQVYEKENRKVDAIKTYELALASASPPPDTRSRLALLLGDDKRIDEAVGKIRSEVDQRHVTKLKRVATEDARADFWVLLSPGPKVQGVRFISGDETFRSLATDIQAMFFTAAFPNDDDTRILRRGILSCSKDSRECLFTLMPVELVRSVN